MEPVVVDPKIVGYFVDEGDVNFFPELVETVAVVQERLAIYDDAIGKFPVAVGSTLRQGYPVVEPEYVVTLGVVFDNEYDVVEVANHLVGEGVQSGDDETLELFPAHLDHTPSVAGRESGHKLGVSNGT